MQLSEGTRVHVWLPLFVSVSCSLVVKKRVNVPLFKALCLNLSHCRPPRSFLKVHHRGPKAAQLRSVLQFQITKEEHYPEADVHETKCDGLDCEGGKSNLFLFVCKVLLISSTPHAHCWTTLSFCEMDNKHLKQDSAVVFCVKRELEMHPEAHQTDTVYCILCSFASTKVKLNV